MKISQLAALRIRTIAYLLLIIAWLSAAVVNGLGGLADASEPAFMDFFVRFATSFVIGGAGFILILWIGLKRPWISGILFLFLAILSLFVTPDFFEPGHWLEGQTLARVLSITHTINLFAASILLIFSSLGAKTKLYDQDKPIIVNQSL